MDTLRFRKTIRHYDEPGHVHELTFSCFNRQPLLLDETHCKLLAESINNATQRHGFHLVAFVFMPEHVHLLVVPVTAQGGISDLLFAIKRPFSYRVKKNLEANNPILLARLTVRERPGKMTFRFWQEGPGYDRNLTSADAVLASIEYIHNNPIKRGLCKTQGEWKWSSWASYHRPDLVDAACPLVNRFVG